MLQHGITVRVVVDHLIDESSILPLDETSGTSPFLLGRLAEDISGSIGHWCVLLSRPWVVVKLPHYSARPNRVDRGEGFVVGSSACILLVAPSTGATSR